jgi:hypothetical protein
MTITERNLLSKIIRPIIKPSEKVNLSKANGKETQSTHDAKHKLITTQFFARNHKL